MGGRYRKIGKCPLCGARTKLVKHTEFRDYDDDGNPVLCAESEYWIPQALTDEEIKTIDA